MASRYRSSRLVRMGLPIAFAASIIATVPDIGTAAERAPEAVSVSAALPPKSVKHSEAYWSWFAPRRWIGSSGAYGINISNPSGSMVLDYGFSSIVCASANTLSGSVTAYFAQQRASLSRSLRASWRKVKVKAGRIRQLPAAAYGVNYFRQTLSIKGKGRGSTSFPGVRFRGELVYDYSLASGPTYCFSRSQSRVAPAKGFRASIRQLRSVQGALAYFGPGVAGGGGNEDPDQ